jgi:hypothetical protein
MDFLVPLIARPVDRQCRRGGIAGVVGLDVGAGGAAGAGAAVRDRRGVGNLGGIGEGLGGVGGRPAGVGTVGDLVEAVAAGGQSQDGEQGEPGAQPHDSIIAPSRALVMDFANRDGRRT